MPDNFINKENKPVKKPAVHSNVQVTQPATSIIKTEPVSSLTALNNVFDAFVDREYDFVETKNIQDYKSIM